MTLLLALAYAAVAALLLNLGLAAAWSARIKAAAVVAVSLLYGGTYLGLRALEGWPTREPLPSEFRLQWVSVEEPDKATRAPGAIWFWVRALDAAGRPQGEPRAHALPWDEATASAAREALEVLRGGRRVNGRITLGLIRPEEGAPGEAEAGSGAGRAGRLEERPRLEFREVPPPDLPAKPPL